MRGQRSAATALYLALNLEKTFVAVRIMAPNSYPTDAFKRLKRRCFFARVVEFGS
jgi:hypothetical protein